MLSEFLISWLVVYAAMAGLYLATGHEGDGVCLAPITGRIVAEGLVHSRWPSELSSSRLIENP